MATIRRNRCRWLGCYAAGWVSVISDRDYVVGLYCARHAETALRAQNAEEARLEAEAEAAFQERSREIRRKYFGVDLAVSADAPLPIGGMR